MLAQLLACHKYQSVDPGIPVDGTVARLQALIDSQSAMSAAAAEDSAYGLFTEPTTQTDDEAFGFFDEPVGQTPADTAGDDTFGFFDDQPGAFENINTRDELQRFDAAS